MAAFIEQYITLVQQKQDRQANITELDLHDPQRRLQGLLDEVQEVSEELKPDNKVYLEDELGDIFWNYINFLVLLQKKGYISDVQGVLLQSYQKFHERTTAILNKIDKQSSDEAWDVIKKIQKQRLHNLHNDLYNK